MSGAAIRIEGLNKALEALERTRSARQLGDVVKELLVAGVKRNFQLGMDPDTGAKWAPIKNRKGLPLRDKGRLMRSIHGEVTGSGFSTKVSIGTNLIYAATHQFGDPERKPKTAKLLAFKVFGVWVRARRVSIPQRKFLPFTDAGLDRMTSGQLRPTIEKYLQQEWK